MSGVGRSSDGSLGVATYVNVAGGAVPEKTRANVGDHGSWKRGTTTLFDIHIVNLASGTYLCMIPEKDIAEAEKEKKDIYLQDCLKCRPNFNPLFFSTNKIPGKDAWKAPWKMASHLRFKLKREYYEMYGFVWERMVLAVV